ncbi:MAG: two-component system response regulator NarL [Pseudomonadota bacterium]|nr:two-component system response regulator NarL [Pseudomonadota bacterium]
MNNAPTRVLVVDDHPLFRRGVLQLLGMASDLTCVAEAADPEQAVQAAVHHRPDLTLLDLNLGGAAGLHTLETLRAGQLGGRIVMLTVSDCEEDVVACLRAGADGYLLKDMEPEQILSNLRVAASGQMVLSPSIAGVLAKVVAGHQPSAHDLAHLTSREQDILSGISRGDSNKAIARRHGISEGTVKVHVKHVLKKLGLKSRVQAAVWAVEHGLH